MSVVPRAEIARIVMQHGLVLGPSVVPPEAMFVAVVTCIGVPLVLESRLREFRDGGPVSLAAG